jgi:5-methylcytosine-specific restriction endonuclease McrA
MKKHTKIYLKHFGYTIADFIPCEICGAKSVDIHHLIFKQMGGSKLLDYIENLIAVCRSCHNKCHDHPEFNEKAKEIHLKNL